MVPASLAAVDVVGRDTMARPRLDQLRRKPVDRKDVKGPETYTGDITLWMSWSKSFMRFLRRKD